MKEYGQAMSHGTTAQMFAVVAGVVLTVLGIAGLIVSGDFSSGNSLTAERLAFFDVNGWSSAVYLVTGLVLLYGAIDVAKSHLTAIAIGGLYLVLTVWSLLDGSILGLLPVNDPTAIVYAAIAVVGLAAGIGPNRSESSD
ncbi:MAG: DUF4383 domain-containing protein [Solirubrobacterales bacterium]